MPREVHDNGGSNEAPGGRSGPQSSIVDSLGRSVEVVLPTGLLNDVLGLALLEETSPADQIRTGILSYCSRRIATEEILELISEARNRRGMAANQQQDEAPAVRGRAVILHMSESDFNILRGLAILDGVSLSTVVREATSEHVEDRLRDVELSQRFDSMRSRDRTALEDVAAAAA